LTNQALKANFPQEPKRPPTVTLTKADIVDAIHKKVGRSKAQPAELVESLLEIIKWDHRGQTYTGCCANENPFERSLKRFLSINLGEAEDQRFELFES
jgi:hypothetical protein